MFYSTFSGENPQTEKSMDPSKTEPLCDNVELKSKARDLTSACSLSFIHCASDPAKVVLDALRKCRSANLGKCKYGPSSLMKRFSDLLEHLREVSPEITPQVKIEAVVLAVEWRETLTGSQLNYSEVLGFLQLLATFELSSSYDSDELLGLLEIVYQSRRAINLFKIQRLADKIPGMLSLSLSCICTYRPSMITATGYMLVFISTLFSSLTHYYYILVNQFIFLWPFGYVLYGK